MVDHDLLFHATHVSLLAGWNIAREALFERTAFENDPTDAFFYNPPGKSGDPALPIDVMSHDAMESAMKQHIPEIVFVSEELQRPIHHRDGSLLAIADPIDGTRPLEHLGDGWGMTLQVLERFEGTWQIVLAGVVSTSGAAVFLVEEHTVKTGLIDRPISSMRVIAGLPSAATLSVAIVGAAESDAPAFRALQTSLRGGIAFNLGGAPMCAGVICRRLGGIISLKPQSTWDAVYAPIISITDGTVGLLDGRELSPSEVLDFFREVKFGMDARVVPPLIAARDRESYARIVEALAGAALVPTDKGAVR